jgi:hypothetical protein
MVNICVMENEKLDLSINVTKSRRICDSVLDVNLNLKWKRLKLMML